MPSWKIHLSIASHLTLPITNKDTFLLANVAPDIENGWIIKDVLNLTDSAVSHVYAPKGKGQELPDLKKFLKLYGHTLSCDAGLGYYVHLLTDYYWNNLVNQQCYIYNHDGLVLGIRTLKGFIKGDKSFCTRIKQHDFQIFADNLILDEYPLFKNISNTDIKNFQDYFHIPKSDLIKAVNRIIQNTTPPPPI